MQDTRQLNVACSDVRRITVDLSLIWAIISVRALMFCLPGMANASTRALYSG